MTWSFQRQDDALIVTFDEPISEGWSELFEALKDELASGVKVVVFANDLPTTSVTTAEVFHALIQYLSGSGVQVHRSASPSP